MNQIFLKNIPMKWMKTKKNKLLTEKQKSSKIQLMQLRYI